MNYKNKDLYQVLKISKNASQQEIDNLALTISSKDNNEVNKALIVLCKPANRKEYDKIGWQPKWDREFDEWIAACRVTFKAIHSHIGYGVEAIYHPDGKQIWLMGADLDPKLWAPFNSPSADANWIEKIYSIKGPNWRSRMKDYESSMLAEIERVRAERQKTPYTKANWEYVDSGNCAKCGQKAKIRDARGEDKNVYCSQKCYFDNWESRYKRYEYKVKIPKYEVELPKEDTKADLICMRCHKKDKDVYEIEDGGYYHKSCFWEKNKESYNKDKKDENPSPNPRYLENPSSDKIKNLETKLEHYKKKLTEVPAQDRPGVQDLIKEIENQLKMERAKNFFSKKNGEESVIVTKTHNRFTGETTTTKQKHNPLQELLNWMKKEGIVNISLNSNGNLVVEYSGSQTKIVNDNELTTEQKEIKEFFHAIKGQGGETYFNQKELEKTINQETNQENKDKNNNGLAVAVIISLIAIILILIGVIVYKNKKKSY